MTNLVLATVLLFASDPQTERLFKAKCASCHGDDGKGQTDQGKKYGVPDFSAVTFQKSKTDDQLKEEVGNPKSVDKSGQKLDIHGYKTKLRADQIDALIKHVRGFAK
jgi:cytochrome c